jgi:hypothetical protein
MMSSLFYCFVDFLYIVFKYYDALLLKHSEVLHSRCQCSAQRKSKRLIWASHTIIPLARRLEISCLRCNKLIYHCNIAVTKGVPDFEINIR